MSILVSIPVGIIFTEPQYGGDGDILGSIGNILDYFTNGTKISYMFLMWPLGIILRMPLFLSIAFPIAIIVLRINYGTIADDSVYPSILGIIIMLVIIFFKKRGSLNWYFKADNTIPNYVLDFSIFAWAISTSYFLAQYFAHYILNNLSNDFKPSGGGFFSIPVELEEYITGFPILFVLIVAILFGTFGKERSWYSIILFAIPALLIAGLAGGLYFLWTIAFFTLGILISKALRKLFKRNSAQGLN
jgi:hypothetical protein